MSERPHRTLLGRLADRLLPDRREIARLHGAPGVFQPFPTTSRDRYPQVFNRLAAELEGLETPRILSFGCSSGEEVRALRKRLPRARIDGIDTNRRMIARAGKADRHPLSRYTCADRPDPAARFDAVLALAVFRHGGLRRADPPETSLPLLDFAMVDEACNRLDAVLEAGGLLMFGNSQFRFEDLSIAPRYDLFVHGKPAKMTDPLYSRENRRIGEINGRVSIYRKLAS